MIYKGQRFQHEKIAGIVEIVDESNYIHRNGNINHFPQKGLEQVLRNNKWKLCESENVLSILQLYPE